MHIRKTKGCSLTISNMLAQGHPLQTTMQVPMNRIATNEHTNPQFGYIVLRNQ